MWYFAAFKDNVEECQQQISNKMHHTIMRSTNSKKMKQRERSEFVKENAVIEKITEPNEKPTSTTSLMFIHNI